MGTGNYWLANAETVYIDCDDVYHDEDDIMDEICFMDFVDVVTSLIPVKSFYPCEKYVHGFRERRLVIAENGWYHLSILQWHTYFAVNVELKSAHESDPWEFNPLASYHHAAIARKIFNALASAFQLRVRTSAWTSGLYQCS